MSRVTDGKALSALLVDDLAPGDLIFIGADRGLWMAAASRWSSPHRRFGHVGVVVQAESGALAIVHAKGAPTAARAGIVRAAPSVFLRNASRIGVYRPRDPGLAGGVAEAAQTFADQGLAFDRAFRLDTADKLYCTELVWRALNQALGQDALPNKPTIVGRPAITLAALETLPLLRETRFVADTADGVHEVTQTP